MAEENGVYYFLVKSEKNPARIIMFRGEIPTGSFKRMVEFDEEMSKLETGMYKVPTIFRLNDGRWCLMLDYYGVPGNGQGCR